MAAHSTLTTTELHEPKGAAAASANTVYVADGAASGAWATIDAANINTSSIFNTNKHVFLVRFVDVSTAETLYVPTGFAGTINAVTTVLPGAITTVDATLTVKNAAASSAGQITIAYSGSGTGDVDTLAPSSNNTFTADSWFSIETDGLSSGTQPLVVMIEVTATGA